MYILSDFKSKKKKDILMNYIYFIILIVKSKISNRNNIILQHVNVQLIRTLNLVGCLLSISLIIAKLLMEI